MKVVLKDGTEIKDASIGRVDNILEYKMTKNDAALNLLKFWDPEVMADVEFYTGAYKSIYHGFIKFSHLESLQEDEIRIWMEGVEPYSAEERIPLYSEMYMPKEGE